MAKRKEIIRDTPWMGSVEAGYYMRRDPQRVLQDFKDGKIRYIRNGKKFMTRVEWVDEYLLSLEETGILSRT